MSDSYGITNIDDNSALYEILKHCVSFQSYESLPLEDFNDICLNADCISGTVYLENCSKMISNNQYSISGSISSSSYTSDDSLCDILEENGRISLAYENLRTIPRKIAEKFAMKTKFLDLSYNNFQNLSFLSFFEELHTLILDRNINLDVNSLPFLQNLKILWINNCDIQNVIEWIHRIRLQCPSVEYLSIMGNPGIIEPYGYCTLNVLSNASELEPMLVPKNSLAARREYILQLLPHLRYLDGIPRSRLLKVYHCTTYDLQASTTSSSIYQTNSYGNDSSSLSQLSIENNRRKIAPSFAFKELFLLKRRKKSYPSSSTN